MNNYDFINYTGIIPNNGYYPPNQQNYNSHQNIQHQENKNILDPYQSLVKGNSFANLYNQYKNYKPSNINPINEKESLLNQIQQYSFILNDLDLYLDTNPTNSQIINLYNKYYSIKEQICNKYESMYGPLTQDSIYTGENNWKWINSPWPWEGVK